MLIKNDIDIISSSDFAKLVHVSPEQFRKDLSYFGEFGKRGVGYETAYLQSELEKILGVDQQRNVALIGAGQLGGALLNYPDFSQNNINITTAFDSDPGKIGSIVNGIEIKDIERLKEYISKSNIEICILCVPAKNVQRVAKMVVDAGVHAILNFTSVMLNVPENVFVSNIDMSSEIERLVFFLNKQ